MNTLPATIASQDPYSNLSKIAAEESGSALLKFSKGQWLSGETPMNGAVMRADMANLIVGWRKWSDNKIVGHNIGYVAEGFIPKDRKELDDQDEAKWPKNKKNEPQDPWQHGYYLMSPKTHGNMGTI
jgi:hypothetical protein